MQWQFSCSLVSYSLTVLPVRLRFENTFEFIFSNHERCHLHLLICSKLPNIKEDASGYQATWCRSLWSSYESRAASSTQNLQVHILLLDGRLCSVQLTGWSLIFHGDSKFSQSWFPPNSVNSFSISKNFFFKRTYSFTSTLQLWLLFIYGLAGSWLFCLCTTRKWPVWRNISSFVREFSLQYTRAQGWLAGFKSTSYIVSEYDRHLKTSKGSIHQMTRGESKIVGACVQYSFGFILHYTTQLLVNRLRRPIFVRWVQPSKATLIGLWWQNRFVLVASLAMITFYWSVPALLV